MAKPPPLEEALARLIALKANPATPEAQRELAKALAGKSNLIVAKAAAIVGEARLLDLAGDLPRHFLRFLDATPDKGCAAKTAIAAALNGLLDALGPGQVAGVTGLEEVFRRGVRHVQMEASWGGQVDVAAELRCTSALALSALGNPGVIDDVADLLADRDPQCRIAAARALAHAGHEHGAALLRLRVVGGEAEADVLGELFAAMIRLSPANSVAFVARYLDVGDPRTDPALRPSLERTFVEREFKPSEVFTLLPDANAIAGTLRETALTALGTSRQRAAFDLLRGRWEKQIDGASRRPLLPAFALLRLPESVAFLLDVIAREHRSLAVEAIQALAPYRNDEALGAKLRAAVAERDEAEVNEAIRQAFGPGGG